MDKGLSPQWLLWLRTDAFSVSIDVARTRTQSPFSPVQTELQKVLLNALSIQFGCRRPINPGIVLTMHLMLVKESSLWIIGDPNIPCLGMTAFPLDEFQHFHNDDF